MLCSPPSPNSLRPGPTVPVRLRRSPGRDDAAGRVIAENGLQPVREVGKHAVHAGRDQSPHLGFLVHRVGVDRQAASVGSGDELRIGVCLVRADADGVGARRVEVTPYRLAAPGEVELYEGIFWRLSGLKDCMRTRQRLAAACVSPYSFMSRSSFLSMPGAASGFLVSM
jgi:hypothetical protein